MAIVVHAGQPAIALRLLHVAPGSVAVCRGNEAGGLASVYGRVEIDEEGEDVKGEDKSDDPLDDGGGILVASEVSGHEGDG